MTQTPDLRAPRSILFAAAQRKDMITLQVRVGEDLRQAFEDQAGLIASPTWAKSSRPAKTTFQAPREAG